MLSLNDLFDPNYNGLRNWRSKRLPVILALLGTAGWNEAARAEPPVTAAPVAPQRQVLPVSEAEARRTLQRLYTKYLTETGGKVADHTEVARNVDARTFCIAIATVDGRVIAVGDTKAVFPLQSLSKAFVFGLALEDHGHKAMLKKVGVHATGLPFGSLAATEVRGTKLQNPMVSAGAIAVTSTIKGRSPKDKWRRTLAHLQAFAGREVQPIKKV